MDKPKKIPYTGNGHCENCGESLKKYVWRFGETTACTKKCALEDYSADLNEYLRDEANWGDPAFAPNS